ncbi:tryptophan synthase subunit alpha [Companilactobacillus mishanensis]|uniref:tryptophan synthase subunit alpha n=1 Tax=Companilactobacillus mishanensis TaxID=2486008 RepID=UPI0012950592|nr:tryptophan synthase subunit alpha [Companilactobacillus mishanensis]MQS89223.1 tryptophan synthase subunit alpha [Companilactobacillus mishanensis]
MSKLKKVFENKKAFIPFIVADDPDFDTTVESVVTLAENGADIVELGIPFSDPVADGPVIQDADLRAFKAGVNTDVVFDIVKKIRERTDVPLVFLTYLNIAFKYGYEEFCAKCQSLGVLGLVIPDLSLEEQGELKGIANNHDVDIIPLVAPTSGDRIEAIAESATGFIYMVSSLGVTGVREDFSKQLSTTVDRIKKVTDVPVAIGFGIHSPEQAEELSEFSDGIIIGSAVVKMIDEGKPTLQNDLANFAQGIKQAITVKA